MAYVCLLIAGLLHQPSCNCISLRPDEGIDIHCPFALHLVKSTAIISHPSQVTLPTIQEQSSHAAPVPVHLA